MNNNNKSERADLRPRKHGGYSFLVKGELPERRGYLLSYLTDVRAGLIQDLGPTEQDLTTAQAIIIDRIVSMLGVVRCIEEHTRENTVMVGGSLASALKESYLAYNNSIRLDLQVLGINERAEGRGPTVQEVIDKFDKEKAEGEGEKEREEAEENEEERVEQEEKKEEVIEQEEPEIKEMSDAELDQEIARAEEEEAENEKK